MFVYLDEGTQHMIKLKMAVNHFYHDALRIANNPIQLFLLKKTVNLGKKFLTTIFSKMVYGVIGSNTQYQDLGQCYSTARVTTTLCWLSIIYAYLQLQQLLLLLLLQAMLCALQLSQLKELLVDTKGHSCVSLSYACRHHLRSLQIYEIYSLVQIQLKCRQHALMVLQE